MMISSRGLCGGPAIHGETDIATRLGKVPVGNLDVVLI
jgi:hypothetical protein